MTVVNVGKFITQAFVDELNANFAAIPPDSAAAIIAALTADPAVIPNGSAAAPGLAFVNSPTTGFYRAGPDQLGFAVAGVSVGTFTASGLAAVLTNSTGLPLSTGVTGLLAIANGGTAAATTQAAAANLSVDYAVADLAALKALTSRPEVVTVKTGPAAGVWQWVLGSSTTADDALVVNPTSGTAGRYKRIVGSYYDRDWFAANADATTAQATANNILLIPPTTDGFTSGNTYVGVTGAKTRDGINTGHMAIGPVNIHAFVGLHYDETYASSEQEMRGVSSLVRYYRTTADEGTLGWDIFGVMGGLQVTAANTQYIRGNMKGVVGELYFIAPSSGSYSVKHAYNFQASAVEVGASVTLENYYGLVINSPTGSGTIDLGYGIHIEDISKPTTKAAINLAGVGQGGRILWPGSVSLQAPSSGVVAALSGTTTLWTATLATTTSTFVVGNGGAGVNFAEIDLNFGTNGGVNNLNGAIIAKRNGTSVGQLQWTDGGNTLLDMSGTQLLIRNAFGGSTMLGLSNVGAGTLAGVLTTRFGTAIAAGVATQAFIKASSTADFGIYYGTGDPSFSAAKGSLYTKTDATTTTTRLWVNTNGTTGWANFTASA